MSEKLEFNRTLHRLATYVENGRESALTKANPKHKTLLEQRGVKETNIDRKERRVLRMSKNLNVLGGDADTHQLLTHQGLYIDPYVWQFRKGGKNFLGKDKLQIECEVNPDLSKWQTYEDAGMTKASDSEVYNSCRMHKKVNNKVYSLWNANCQHGADDVAYDLTQGKSTLTPAPSRRKASIIVDKFRTEGVSKTLTKATKTAAHLSDSKRRDLKQSQTKNESQYDRMLEEFEELFVSDSE